MATEDQLIGAVLDVLGATPGSGQGYNEDDVERVRPYLQDILDDLALRKVIYAPDADSLPGGSVQWVAAIIASAPTLVRFYRPTDVPDVQFAESMLRAQRANYDYTPIRIDYF